MASRYLRKQKKSSLELLWRQFIKGDMRSFRSIYETNYQHLYNFGLTYLTPDEVEDCIQNLFLYILQHRKSIAKVKNVKAYLFISFRNQIARTKKSEKFNFQQLDLNLSENLQVFSKESMIPELHGYLKKLSPRENQVIHLKYYENFKNMEIAESLGLEYQTVRNTLTNALKKLRKSPLQNFLFE
ncbi:MAG: sigma-70 family RNA polymerase sigma factor [Bacteroidota bacterium]